MEILGLSSHSPFSIQTPRVVLFFYSLYFVTYSFYHIAVFFCTFSHHFVTTVFFCVCHCCIIKNDEIQNKIKTKTHTFHYFLCALCDMNCTTIARNDGNACRKYARWATTSTTTSSLSIILCELLSLSYGQNGVRAICMYSIQEIRLLTSRRPSSIRFGAIFKKGNLIII